MSVLDIIKEAGGTLALLTQLWAVMGIAQGLSISSLLPRLQSCSVRKAFLRQTVNLKIQIFSKERP